MSSSLNVIALISGGKDSFFSILHCLQNGHKVVALANLYPPAALSQSAEGEANGETIRSDEHDLNSFMYQTVGHTIIPLYEKALGIPLYRQEIIGTAVQKGISYNLLEGGNSTEPEDETESLVPLLKCILKQNPAVNALCTGAILSTYQRTRIESVALRLGLTPLAYLWKYPILPPSIQTSLLEDMHDVGFDARIVKVASGGLDESFLWQNVASEEGLRRVGSAMKRYGVDGDGAVIGEGGEFETIVLDGPGILFRGRIVVPIGGRRVVREGGGAAWLSISGAEIVMKGREEPSETSCRVPDLLDWRFKEILETVIQDKQHAMHQSLTRLSTSPLLLNLSQLRDSPRYILNWTASAQNRPTRQSISGEATNVIQQIQLRLSQSSLTPQHIVSTTIILRSMQDFTTINKIYSTLFPAPNPPSRVTISCGNTMPANTNIIIHLQIHNPSPGQQSPKSKALHVQSRSYWAPANIGPYSQAISTPAGNTGKGQKQVWTVNVAGQIPLVPQIMSLPPAENLRDVGVPEDDVLGEFKLQTVLSMQHLWRIGKDMDIGWWTSAVAYLPRGAQESVQARAEIARKAWIFMHKRDSDRDEEEEDDNPRDLWEEKHYAGMESWGGGKTEKEFPDWEMIETENDDVEPISPFFAVEVEELPRQSGIEWHAHLGIVNGPVKLYNRTSPDRWKLYACTFADVVHLLVLVNYFESADELKKRRYEALEFAGIDLSTAWRSYASYLDSSIPGTTNEEGDGGVIPCRSIWSGDGERFGAVWLLEGALVGR